MPLFYVFAHLCTETIKIYLYDWLVTSHWQTMLFSSIFHKLVSFPLFNRVVKAEFFSVVGNVYVILSSRRIHVAFATGELQGAIV